MLRFGSIRLALPAVSFDDVSVGATILGESIVETAMKRDPTLKSYSCDNLVLRSMALFCGRVLWVGD